MEEKEKVKESLMINPLAYPEEKFTEDGKSYYYTRGDGTPLDKLASIIPKVDPELVQHRLYGRTRQNS